MAAESGAAAAPAGNWVERALDQPSGWALRNRIPWLLGVIMFFDSWDSAVIAFTLPVLGAQWQLSPITSGWLISAGFGGQFIGAIAFGIVGERFGRLPVWRLLILVMAVLAIACGLAQSYEQMLVLRFVQGLAIGGAVPLANSYINEIAPTATRGKFFGTFQFLWLIGFGVCAWVAAVVIPAWGWRPMYMIGALPLLLLPFTLRLPESPRWLAVKGRAQDAVSSLRRLGLAENEPVLPDGRIGAAARVSPLALLEPGVRRTTLVIFVLWFLTSLVGFGLNTWAPTIFVSNFGIPVEKALSLSSIDALAVFFTPLLVRQTIDRYGRRPPAIVAGVVAAATLLAMIFIPTSQWLALVTLLIVGHVGIAVATIVLWPWTAEVFETRVRAIGLGFASSLARAASMLSPLAVGGVIQLTGSVHAVFAIFGGSALIVTLLWLFATRETAGRSLGT